MPTSNKLTKLLETCIVDSCGICIIGNISDSMIDIDKTIYILDFLNNCICNNNQIIENSLNYNE